MNRMMGWALLLVVGLWLTVPVVAPSIANPVVAADDHSGEHKEEPIAARAGLTRADLGIYTLAVFFLLLFILGKFAWGPMINGLDAREAGLKKVHSDAELAKAESQKALAEIQTRLAKANDEIRAMLDEARRDAQVVKDKLKAEATTEITAERDRLRREIETARDSALNDIYKQSVELAALLSSKAVKRELTPADHARLLDEALGDMKLNLSKT